MAEAGPEIVPILSEALAADNQGIRVAAAGVLRELGRGAKPAARRWPGP